MCLKRSSVCFLVFYLFIQIHFYQGKCESEDLKDTKEGEDVTLECRFPPHLAAQEPTFYWLKKNKNNSDNVAIGQTPLDTNYRLDFKPEQGRYDLLISNASFERDNGHFKCRVKAGGSGKDLHTQAYIVTVLTLPGEPKILPSANPTATEGKPLEISCSTAGGSPDPIIRWYRNGIKDPIDSAVKKMTEMGATSVLTLKLSKNDDGAVYRCTVWNRAMPSGTQFEASLTLNVNYYPRVEIGPENPLRVERDGTVTLECNVDSKPRANTIRWSRNGRYIGMNFTHKLSKVTLQDAGKYTCSADNGLGQTGEAELVLDIQYPPQVTIESDPGVSKHREADEGETLMIKCNVSANPPPKIIEWTREGRSDVRQQGEILKLHRVSADSAGTYTCRAVNTLTLSTSSQINRVGNASITLLVRHKPGQAHITPDRPIATEGSGVTLTCLASPPGWPVPEYKWWRDLEEINISEGNSQLNGPKYNIPSAHLGNEGKYHCQAINDLGQGDVATVVLTVHQPPRITLKLPPHIKRRIGDSEFSAVCKGQGKPKPSIKWFKDGKEVSPKLYEITTDESEGRNAVFTVQSVLKFVGRDRRDGTQLNPGDSGVYTCVFENEVKRVETTLLLKIEHEPIILHQYNKVAYDLKDIAEIVCRVQAFPRPEFQWSYSTHSASILAGSDGHYEINMTASNDGSSDIFTSVLKIATVRDADYGDYYCRAVNELGSIKTAIRLQPKGPPERPENLSPIEIGHNSVLLNWNPGFNGGLPILRYFAGYRKVLRSNNDDLDSDCYAKRKSGPADVWHEFDCQNNNPCNVSLLEQHQSYEFKMKAFNMIGNSEYSEVITVITKVDRIPAPLRVTYDPHSHVLSINIAASCLQLVGIVESALSNLPDRNWNFVESLQLAPFGGSSTKREATILSLTPRKFAVKSTGRSLEPKDQHVISYNPDDVRVRVKLCLQTNHETCGDYTEGEIGPSLVKEASSMGTPTIVAIIVSCVVFILFIGLISVYCRCRKKAQNKKTNGKDYEMETSTVHPSIVQQAPPPYYPTTGMENKALEHSLDLALDDPSKNAVYAAQNEYGYHGNPHNNRQHPNGGEWVNMGYMENSYSNSNNGGSVNSQDSLWQMKMAAANNNTNNANSHHHISDRTNHYGGYDPLTHGGYGAVDDYAPYPHLVPSASPDYSRNSNNPSRQDYTSDKGRRRDHHIESPYRDVSGLPDPYLEHQLMLESEENLKPQQHLSISFDESLESGYSTPNSRSRRIIREIIV